ncbi:DUF2158 domain-containing protein [Anatilimnocola floriformis]|uniref:DUF2158 domain-containing protein n=1 Tax=Anatilimnocola floriformis TaxID=2948575 RepID=UPI0020C30141|nr:DUF2158 domain-containing protein [Anatilimnocola floriformis]
MNKEVPNPFYQSGDLVRLKSGGPTMTVETVTPAGLLVSWFDGNTLHRDKLFFTLVEPTTKPTWHDKKKEYRV